jgi:hypothetical protein
MSQDQHWANARGGTDSLQPFSVIQGGSRVVLLAHWSGFLEDLTTILQALVTEPVNTNNRSKDSLPLSAIFLPQAGLQPGAVLGKISRTKDSRVTSAMVLLNEGSRHNSVES